MGGVLSARRAVSQRVEALRTIEKRIRREPEDNDESKYCLREHIRVE